MSGPASVPITDDERSAAVVALRAAAEDGRLDPRVLDARVDLVRVARSRGDLEAALYGLGGARPIMGPPARSGPGVPTAPGYRPDDPLRLTGGMSALRRRGPWTVPPYLRVHALASTVLLDLLDASCMTEVVDMTVVPGAGSVRLVLPPGWAMDADRLGRGVGSTKVSVPRLPDPGGPLLVVHGSIGAGSLKARGPSSRERRRRGWAIR